MRTAAARGLALGAILALLVGSASDADAQGPPRRPRPGGAPPGPAGPAGEQAAPPAGAAQPEPAGPSTIAFGSDVGIVINPIKPDKTADFEAIVARLREALRSSENPVRRQQYEGWKVLRADEPGPAGAVLYFFVLDPPVKDADYTVSRLLAEAFPDEVGELWAKLREAYAAGPHRVSLRPLASALPTPSAPVK